MEPKYLLIVKVPAGLIVRDTPRPESMGGKKRRTEPVGAQLYAYSIHKIEGVPYARLVPQVPERPEWVRVAEADGNVQYADVMELTQDENELAAAIRLLAASVRALVKV